MQRKFLSRILPVLPLPGPFGNQVCWFALNLKGAMRRQEPCGKHDSICAHANAGSAAGFESYMALASFKSPFGGRKKDNAEAARSIWMDIDCGKPNSVYKDSREAIQALARFGDSTGLNPTVIVSSGKGLHCYYTFDRNVPVDQWVQLAGYFHQLCIQEGLDVDPSRAKDITSVLRLPGTIHQKTGNVVKVIHDTGKNYTPRQFFTLVAARLQAPAPVAVPVYTPQAVQPPGQTDQLAEFMGMGPKPPTANAEKIIRNCRQVLTMGQGLYPQWFAGMSVLKRCVDGLEWAQKLSAVDASRYDPADTERKFSQANVDGPVTCLRFEEYNPVGCLNCPHRGTVKTPVQLTYISEAPTPAPASVPAQPVPIPLNSPDAVFTGHLPRLVMPSKDAVAAAYLPMKSPQYSIDHRGVIWNQSTQDANKNWVTTEHVITSVQVWFKYTAHRAENGKHQTMHYFDLIFPNSTTREIRVVAGEDMTDTNIMKLLYSADVAPRGSGYNGKVFMGFFNAYLDSVMNIKKVVPIVKEFGWTKFDDPVLKQNVNGFVVGSGVITESGIHPVGVDPGTTGIYADRAFAHAGSLDEWKHVPRMYMTLGQQMSMFGMCCSLASPFMKYGIAEAKNSYVNLYSNEGGKGKSTLLRAMHSIWGNPAYAFGSPNASVSQRGKAMSVWNNLPYFVDEVTRMKNEDMNNMVYTLAGGMDKDRLKSNADLTMTGQWSMFTMSTANRSVKEALAKHAGDTDATLLRVTEFECDFPNYDGAPEVQKYIRAVCDIMENHHGLAGAEFMYQIMRHPERLATLRALVDNWRIKHGLRDSERFLAFSVGIPLHIGRWAVEWGIFEFDMDALEKWVLEVLVPFNRQNTADLSPDHVNNFTTYLNSRLPSMLQVLREKRGADELDGKRPGMYDKYVIRYPQYNELSSRYEQDNNTLYLSCADFKRWCDMMGISPNTLVKSLAAAGIVLESTRANLGSQVSWLPTSRMRCYVIRSDILDRLGWRPSVVRQDEPPGVSPGATLIDGVTSLEQMLA